MSSSRKVTPLGAPAPAAAPDSEPSLPVPRRLPAITSPTTRATTPVAVPGLDQAPLGQVTASPNGAPKSGAGIDPEFSFVERADKREAKGFSDAFVGAFKDAYREPDRILVKTVELDVGMAYDASTKKTNDDMWVTRTLDAPGGSVHAYAHITSEDGKLAGEYTAEHLLDHIQAAEHFPTDLDKALQEGFFTTDDLFYRLARQMDPRDVSYASVTVILAHGWDLHIASVGANRTFVIGQDAWADLVSADHRPHMNSGERERLRKKRKKGVKLQAARPAKPWCGVFDCRCLSFSKDLVVTPGDISYSRAIGAVEARWDRVGGVPDSVIAEPALWRHELDYENNFAVVMGSPTFWSYFPSPRVAFLIVISASIMWLRAAGKRAMHERTMAARRKADLARGIRKKAYVARPAPEIGLTRAGYCAHKLMEFANRFRHARCCKCGKAPPISAASVAVIIPPGIDRGMTSFPILKRFRVPEPENVHVTCCGFKCCKTGFFEEFPLEQWKAREAEADKARRAALEAAKSASKGKYQPPRRMPLSKDLRHKLKLERAARDKLDQKRLRKEQKRRGVSEKRRPRRRRAKGRPKDDGDDDGPHGGLDELSSLSSSSSSSSSSDEDEGSDRWA